MPDVTADGCRLSYAVDGPADAPPFLLLHSLGTTVDLWTDQLERFRRSFRVIRPDIRGHGRSDAPTGAYSLDRLGRDALAVLDAAGAPRAHVCGESLGGLVAQWLGVHAPDRVDRIVVANTAARLGTPELWEARIDAARESGMKAMTDAVIARWFTEGFRQREPATVERFRAMLAACPVDGYTGCCATLRDADLGDAIREIAAPTLVVTGTHDLATPPAAGAFIQARVAGRSTPRARRRAPFERGAARGLRLGCRRLPFRVRPPMDETERHAAGMKVRREILGDAYVDRVVADASDVTADFQDLITRYAWGEIWTRPGLDERTRRVLVIGTLLALKQWDQFRLHVRGAVAEGGFTARELQEIVLQQAIYCGAPSAHTAMRVVRELLEEPGASGKAAAE